jgi:hyaluronan synthase
MLRLTYIFLFLAALVLVVRYVAGSLLKWFYPELHTIKKDYAYQPSVSVLLPCYNEGANVYESIKSIRQSEYPAGRLEIICVDDCSVDDSYEWMLKAKEELPNIQVHKNVVNVGKNKTVLRALSFSRSEMVISIDSDTVFAPDTVTELMACFADPSIGAVGGAVGIRNVNDNVITAFQAFQYYIAFYLGKIAENWTRTVGCISGCLFAIRRQIMVELEPKMASRNWFGIQTSEGEDRFLTHMVAMKGYGTYINLNARCWTTAPNTLMQYFKQQLRWRRSALRDLFLTIRTLPQHTKLSPNVLYVFLLLPLTSLLALLRIAESLLHDPLFWIDPIALVPYMGTVLIVSLCMRKYTPEQAIHTPVKLAAFGVWWIVNSIFLTILACFTLDSGDWGTRTKTAPQAEAAVESVTITVSEHLRPTMAREIEDYAQSAL